MEAQDRATREGFERRSRSCSGASRVDPGFARAWTGLAMTYAGLAEMTGYPADLAAGPRGRGAQGGGAGSGAMPRRMRRWPPTTWTPATPARAEAEFDKALRLNPGSADLLAIYAGWASDFGEPEQGVEAAERAMRLNPDTPAWAVYNFAYAYFMAGRYDDALRHVRPDAGATPTRPAPTSIAPRRWAASAGRRCGEARGRRGPGPAARSSRIEAFAAAYELERRRARAADRDHAAAGFPAVRRRGALAADPDLQRLPECVAS